MTALAVVLGLAGFSLAFAACLAVLCLHAHNKHVAAVLQNMLATETDNRQAITSLKTRLLRLERQTEIRITSSRDDGTKKEEGEQA